MPVDREEVVAYLLGLRLGEVPQLAEILAAELGTSASTYGIAAVDPLPPQQPLAVTLEGQAPGSRLALLRALRKTGLSLRAARDLVDAAPPVVVASLDADAARSLASALEAAGGRVALVSRRRGRSRPPGGGGRP